MMSSRSSEYHIDRMLVTFINNGLFGQLNQKEELPEGGRYRQGATGDAVSVKSAVDFIVTSDTDYVYKENLSAEQIKQHLCDIRNKIDQSPQTYDGLMVIISSHGSTDVILGSDERPINIHDHIINPFHNGQYEGLRGKIKIFVSNACRGEEGRSARVYDSSLVTDIMVDDPLNVISKVQTGTSFHTKGDYVVIYSAAPNSVSVRNPEYGSPLLRHFFGEIQYVAKNKMLFQTSLREIFEATRNRYTEEESESLPGIEEYLRHKIYLPSTSSTASDTSMSTAGKLLLMI